MSDHTETAPSRWRFSMNSFRAKFVIVVGGALLVDLLLAGGVALWNVNRLSRNAIQEVGQGLEKANVEYLQNYINTTVQQTDLLLDRYQSEMNGLAGTMQSYLDNPALYATVGTALQNDRAMTTPLAYNTQGNWWQNQPGEASAVTVWGYLLDDQKQPRPDVAQTVRDSAVFNLVGPSVLKSGPPKLQMYYIGPRSAPILRSTPYSDQGSVFDKVYPGHNETNWWDFYFPGLYENWQEWIKDPSKRPVDSEITTLSPYLDGITGKIIVSFFQPLYTPDRKDLNGIVGVDLTLDQLSDIVKSVQIAETGFGFLSMSNGNVLAVNDAGENTLGVKINNDAGFDRRLAGSNQAAIASLAMPTNADTVTHRITLSQNGEDVPYIVMLKRLDARNLYTGKAPVVSESMSLGFMVPEREVYASLIGAQAEITQETKNIVTWQVVIVVLSLVMVFSMVYAISGRITAGLRALAEGARRLQDKDYSVRVDVREGDEVGAVGVAFNRMAAEISYHTENLENLVTERTSALATANDEISALNSRLKSENLRMGAELDVARHIQMMVLPKPSELGAMPTLDVSGYMEPADEVGGDYFDVLQNNGTIKIGIGDVTGHGLESGVLMLMVQSVARALQEKGGSTPIDFLEVLNRAIYKNIERTQTDKHLSLAFLDYDEQHVTLSGQHEEVLVMRKDGEIDRVDTMDLGFPIGLESDIGPFIATRDIPFSRGDTIVLHTDGVTEAEGPDGTLFGIERLCDSIKKYRDGDAKDIKDGVIADLRAHIGTQKIHDDITLVVIRHR